MLKNIKNLIYNCKAVTLFSVKKVYGDLGVIEEAKMRVHLNYCQPCRQFYEQTKLLKKQIEIATSENSDPIHKLSEEKKVLLQQSIKDNLKE